MIKDQHEQDQNVFAQLQALGEHREKRAKALFEQMDLLLRVHDLIEEAIYYPSFQRVMEDKALEFGEEHHMADVLLDLVEQTTPHSDRCMSKPLSHEAWSATVFMSLQNLTTSCNDLSEGQPALPEIASGGCAMTQIPPVTTCDMTECGFNQELRSHG